MNFLHILAFGLAAAAADPASAQSPPSISVTLSPSAAPEGARYQVTFKRTGDVSQQSTAAWRITGAVDTADFTRSLSGSVKFSAGQSQKGFWLQSVSDPTVEPDEAFDITLSAPGNAVLGASIASATILNDDVATRAPLTLINPGDPAYWTQEDVFINHVHVAGSSYSNWVAQGLLDPVSGRFVKMPAKGGIRIGHVRGGARSPSSANFYKGRWILEWDGEGDLSLVGTIGPLTRVSPNRIEEDYDPAIHGHGNPNIWINAIGSAGVSNIRFYRIEHEPLIAAGEVFDPRWIAEISRFDAFRPLNWTGVNGDIELVAADRPSDNRHFYFGGRVPDAILVRAAMDTGTQLWLNAPGFLGCPADVAQIVRDPAQPVSTRVSAAATAFDAIMASPEPLNWARRIVGLLNSSGYPTNRAIYIELDNEIWSSTQPGSTHLHSGIGRILAQRYPGVGLAGNARTGYGYRSAQYASAFAQALAEAGRSSQQWTMVLATQTVDVRRTTDALAAIPLFSPAVGSAEPMSRYGVSTTNYFSGAFAWHRDNVLFGQKLDQPTWVQQWKAENAADPATFRQKINNYLMSPNAMRSNIAYYMANARAHQAAAQAVGASWIGNYEGDSADKLEPELAADPAALALYRAWHESDDYGRIIRAIADDVRAMNPNAFIGNYVFCAARRTPTTPWVECTPWDKSGADNAAWDQILKPVP